mmetsp:Transcript_11078/g.23471  ORF Transcript_11078/g.23471 Transcript_11078/m.23471 type:complete len:214 (+) Transcript_11078:78-719(+)|eukprot:CAMPEP_0201123456 /NCGR_PEP_ID=MMETSP0850-20130426/7008_1 /ASSEMBLY_ACC=CAM_ASM_000622 /TAXON_ID=183588 /ORGANISM="Pseudo-nitzschia fraudulenta, Strain WWA7" /LENGTH=213 /DNA_ID=CAMNT_0047390369 /DNA_START=64 /DNA_END=705 /DNA_ORIENTATION=+
MKFVLTSTVLASVMTPAFSFSYLDTLGGGVAVVPPHAASNGSSYLDALHAPAPVAPAPVAAAPEPVAAAPVAAYEPAETADFAPAANYQESLSTGEQIHGPGVLSHLDTLHTIDTTMGGPGIQAYTASLPVYNTVEGGDGIHTYCDGLSPTSASEGSYSPFASAAATPSFAGEASADGVAFTLETGDISGLVQDLNAGGTLRLTGSIDNISYN